MVVEDVGIKSRERIASWDVFEHRQSVLAARDRKRHPEAGVAFALAEQLECRLEEAGGGVRGEAFQQIHAELPDADALDGFAGQAGRPGGGLVEVAADVEDQRAAVEVEPDEIELVHRAVRQRGGSVADYLIATVDAQPRTLLNLGDAAQLLAATTALADAPKAVQDLEADLGRLSGRLAHFFTINRDRAELHRDEIRETLWAVQELMRRMLPQIERTQRLVEPARRSIALLMRAVAQGLRNNTSGSDAAGRMA